MSQGNETYSDSAEEAQCGKSWNAGEISDEEEYDVGWNSEDIAIMCETVDEAQP